MRLKLRNVACKRGSKCRRKNCFFGHVCVKPGCNSVDRKVSCKLFPNMHGVDTTVLEWVSPQDDYQHSQWDKPEEDLIMMSNGRERSSSRNQNHSYEGGAALWESTDWRNGVPKQQTESGQQPDWQDRISTPSRAPSEARFRTTVPPLHDSDLFSGADDESLD